jgi:hypothetical protein
MKMEVELCRALLRDKHGDFSTPHSGPLLVGRGETEAFAWFAYFAVQLCASASLRFKIRIVCVHPWLNSSRHETPHRTSLVRAAAAAGLVCARVFIEKPIGYATVFAMSKTLQVKVASETLRARLAASASDNFRTVDQEALIRLERSFEIEDALVSRTHQKWVDAALSGEMRSGSVKRLRTIARKARALAA